MFTGIIEGIGKLKKREENIFTFSHPFGESFMVGESIALSGMCATVLKSSPTDFFVEIIAESRKLTVFENFPIGEAVNLERSAQIGQRNSGHNVQGHIDEVGKLIDIRKEGDYWCLRVAYDAKNQGLVVHKGSVALDGISLTVSGVSSHQPPATSYQPYLEVSIIQHTWQQTTLHNKKIGDGIHIEFDVFGKYIQRQREVVDKVAK